MSDEAAAPSLVHCPGCGALVPMVAGPTHAYYGEAPGCWALYSAILAREYSDARYWSVHRLTVDAYTAQHPGAPEQRTIQSIAVHLIGLYLALECALPSGAHARALQTLAKRHKQFRWLDPPLRRGTLTIADVFAQGGTPVAHTQIVHAWATTVWEAWAPVHAQIRLWATDR